MHAQSSVQFVVFAPDDDAGRSAWCRYRLPTRRDDAPSTDGVTGGWRLVAPNNREIGRGVQLFASYARARGSVMRLQSEAHDLTVSTFHGPSSGTHGWSVTLRGRMVITCARWYETGSICRDAAAHALEAFTGALVSDEHWHPVARRT